MSQRIAPRLDDEPASGSAEPGNPLVPDEGLRVGRRADAVERLEVSPESYLARQRPGRKRASWFVRIVKWTCVLALVVCGLSAALVGSFAIIDPTSTAFMRRTQAALSDARGEPVALRHQWVDRAQISNAARRAVIAAEDQRFATHWGFDIEAMQAAYRANQRGQRVRGASTITQQTMKNLLLSPSRSYARKGVEAWLTLWAELLLSKERILEIYLNSAQFGDDVFGIEAGARAYFDKPAAQLTDAEAAWLAVLLPAPTRYQIQPPTDFTSQRQAWILGQMEYVVLP